MSSIFDRLNHELELFGKKAQAALDEGKLQIELMRCRRRRDHAARDLGLLIHRRERGGEVDQLGVDALLIRLDGLDADIARLEQEIASVKETKVTVHEQPAPSTATTGDAEVVER